MEYPDARDFIGSGFTDDLFPVHEAVRFVNRTRRLHPRTPVAMLLGDFGHMRASNKPRDRALLVRSVHRWLDHHLLGRGTLPRGVRATTQTCPRSAPSRGPYAGPSFAGLARGEVRYAARGPQVFDGRGGDPTVSRAIDPVAGGGDACATTGTAREANSATYVLPRPRRAFTLLGAPTIVARLEVEGTPGVAQVAGRLWDVSPDGRTQTLVARGFLRPRGGGREVWELQPNGWRFEPGHAVKLQLLGADAPFGRPSNGEFSVRVERLALRLPVRERPDCRTVMPRAALVAPRGERLAPGVPARAGRGCGRGGPRLRLRVRCVDAGLRATALVPGVRLKRVRHVEFRVRGRRGVLRDRRPRFSRVVAGGRRPVTVTARAVLRGAGSLSAERRAGRCKRYR